MELTLNTLKPSVGSRKKKLRIGRGNGSGHGTYSGRGTKGQKARSGGTNRLKYKGAQAVIRRIPKLRGFKSFKIKPEIVSISALEIKFKDSETIDSDKLKEVGLIKMSSSKVKVLGGGEFKKKLVVKANSFSKSAKEAIEKAGGKAIVES